jgi:hypothetical protein
MWFLAPAGGSRRRSHFAVGTILLDFSRDPPVHYDEQCGAREHGIVPIQVVNPSAVPRDR